MNLPGRFILKHNVTYYMWKCNRYDKIIRKPHTIIVDEDAWKYLKSEGLNISAFFEELFDNYIEKEQDHIKFYNKEKQSNSDAWDSQ